jgi:general stress protein 26
MTEPTTASRPSLAAYGIPEDGAVPLEWSTIEAKLRGSRNYWICSTRPDGRPHSVPVWGVWHNGALYFGSEPASVKARNLATNPAISVHLESGDDVVIFEGTAKLIPLAAVGDRINPDWQRKYNMSIYDAGTDSEASFYEVRPTMAMAWLETDFVNTATRWRW